MTCASWEVPFNDLRPAIAPIRQDILRAMERVVDRGVFVNGPEVEAFESEWARYCGQDYCVATASGTDAIACMMVSFPYKSAVVQSNTCRWTAVGISEAQIEVIPEDCCRTGTAKPDECGVPVMLYGRFAETDGRYVDACQAHGWKPSRYHNAAWSFYPTKNLGSHGDAGAVTTCSPVVAQVARDYAAAMHSRMSEQQAAVLQVKLAHLDRWNEERNRIAAVYYEELPEWCKPVCPPDWKSNHHLFAVLIPNRDKVRTRLAERNVQTAIHYDRPLAPLPNATHWCDSVLSLPMWIGLSPSDVRHVCDCMRNAA